MNKFPPVLARYWCHAALVAVLLVALALRIYSIRFGLPALLDPDEPVFELGALRMISGGKLNPEWFGHPATTTMYMLALLDMIIFAIGYLTGRFDGLEGFTAAIYHDPGILILPHRIAIAVIAVIGIGLVYRLTSRIFDRNTGLVCAAILAVSPVHITYSQLVRSDMMATVFALGVMLAALTYARTGSWKAFVGACVLAALATTTKWPFAISLLALMSAAGLRWRSVNINARTMSLLLVGSVALTLIAIVIISPYLVLDHARVIANLNGEKQAHHLGANGGTFFSNILWYLTGPMQRAIGVSGMCLVAIGLALVAANCLGDRAESRRASQEFTGICFAVALAMLFISSSQSIIWERWVLLLVPVAAMLAAHGLVQICRVVQRKAGQNFGTAATMICLAGLTVPLAVEAHGDGRARLNDTRIAADRWIAENVQPGSLVLVEHFAFDLTSRGNWTILFPMGEAGCTDVRDLLQNRLGNAEVDSSRNGRSNLDFGTLPPALADECRPDYAVLTHYRRYEAERGIFAAEYANYRRLLARGQAVMEFRPQPGVSAGPATLIIRFGREDSHATIAR